MNVTRISTVLTISGLALALAQTPASSPQSAKTPAPASQQKEPPQIPGVPRPTSTPPPAVSVAPDAVVLTIGDRKVTRAQFEAFISNLPDQLKVAAAGPQKRKFVEQYAELEAMAHEARNRKIDQKQSTQQLVQLQTDQVLANQLYQEIGTSVKPDEAALKAYYDGHKGEYEEAKARHILIRFKGSPVPLKDKEKDLTEDEALAKAKELREKIVKGADFAGLAKAESDDTGSGANGGDLGTFTRGRMVKEFEQVAFTLPVGQISEPVKTQFGYHIIQVESRSNKTFEEAKPQIEAKLKPELTKKAMDDVKAKTPITINDEYFGK